MDRTGARWSFTHYPNGYGMKIVLQKPEHHGLPLEETAGVAVVMEDRTAAEMAVTLQAVEDAFLALPEPPAPTPPVEEGGPPQG